MKNIIELIMSKKQSSFKMYGYNTREITLLCASIVKQLLELYHGGYYSAGKIIGNTDRKFKYFLGF